ncbi:MAG: hypothetical protein KJO42_16070, partial [Silicimonas sp.]|nr:hypothetical protein [Silicimonas sp.]
MDPTFLNDAARALHLFGLALGFGTAIVADLSAARLVVRPLDAREIATLVRFHRMVAMGLAAFWASVLVLLWLRTGFDPANFSAKLMAKLGVVTLLTVNAFLIGRVGLPALQAFASRRFGTYPAPLRMQLSLLGALSTAGWIAALALGVFSQLKTMPWSVLSELIGTIYLVAILGA